jgi:hypothetical protein
MAIINTSNSTFEKFILEGCLYVDKTASIHHWIGQTSGQYFLARPRRFGKSLLISTFKAIFEGRRELFKGLAIDELDYDWNTYPVIHLNMGSCVGQDLETTKEALTNQLEREAKRLGISLTPKSPSVALTNMIDELHSNQGPVVVLVDEYDKPLLGHLGTPLAKEIQSLLKSFYGVIKTCEAQLRFAFITGISKFSKVSIFSDLNNLTDLSMHREAGTLLGYTQEELESNFREYIDVLKEELGVDREEVLARLKRWYNGYRFHGKAPRVYNPVSTMKCFAERDFKNFWFETATPTFLIDLLKRSPLDTSDLSLPESAFAAYDPERLEVLPLLVQTGYLTIREVEDTGDGERFYTLDYPNLEVERSFGKHLLKGLGEISDAEMGTALRKMYKALQAGEVETLLQQVKVFFAGIPYDIQLDNEKYYQTIFVALFRVLGAFAAAEWRTSDGRIDALLISDKQVLVFEFKLHDSSSAAMAQIKAKDYGLSWQADGREVLLIGVGFDPQTRNLGEWIIERG